MDIIPDRIYVKDAAYRFVLTNQAVVNNWPQYDGNIIGKTDDDLFDTLPAQTYRASDSRVLAGEKIIDREDEWASSCHGCFT
jgi:hypothetical protein